MLNTSEQSQPAESPTIQDMDLFDKAYIKSQEEVAIGRLLLAMNVDTHTLRTFAHGNYELRHASSPKEIESIISGSDPNKLLIFQMGAVREAPPHTDTHEEEAIEATTKVTSPVAGPLTSVQASERNFNFLKNLTKTIPPTLLGTAAVLGAIKLENPTKVEANDFQCATTTGLNLRNGPGTSSAILGSFPPETPLVPTGVTEGDWIQVDNNGTIGWVNKSYTSGCEPDPVTPLIPPPSASNTRTEPSVLGEPTGLCARPTVGTANIRSAPDTTKNNIVGRASNGELLPTFQEDIAGWAQIQLEGGRSAWISESVAVVGPCEPPPATIPASQEVIPGVCPSGPGEVWLSSNNLTVRIQKSDWGQSSQIPGGDNIIYYLYFENTTTGNTSENIGIPLNYVAHNYTNTGRAIHNLYDNGGGGVCINGIWYNAQPLGIFGNTEGVAELNVQYMNTGATFLKTTYRNDESQAVVLILTR